MTGRSGHNVANYHVCVAFADYVKPYSRANLFEHDPIGRNNSFNLLLQIGAVYCLFARFYRESITKRPIIGTVDVVHRFVPPQKLFYYNNRDPVPGFSLRQDQQFHPNSDST